MLAIRVVVALAFLVPVESAEIIIRRADRDDSAYIRAGARYPAVIALGRAGDASLIAPDWLITAGHVAASVRNRSTLTIGGREYAIARVAVHAAWRELGPHDIGLVQLSRRVEGVTPLALYRGSGERGSVATLVGHGGAGTGASRDRIEDGRARAATSRVDSVSADWLYFSFDAPPGGTELEGAPGPGDSGGPALIAANGSDLVAGVSSAGYDGRNGPGSYGAVDVFTRVSTHLAWIDSVMRAPNAMPPAAGPSRAPSTGAIQGTTLPDTPAGRRYAAFLASMRAGTDSAILGFLRANFDDAELASRPAEARLANFRRLSERLRDAKVDAIVKSEPLALTARLVGSAGTTTIELICAPGAPNKILDWRRYD